MAASQRRRSQKTDGGNTRDVVVERLGDVTIYSRGSRYYLYYRVAGRRIRRRIQGNLAVARATASKANAALQEGRSASLSFQKVPPASLTDQFLKQIEFGKKLGLRPVDRYRAALEQFLGICREVKINSIEQFDRIKIDAFVL